MVSFEIAQHPSMHQESNSFFPIFNYSDQPVPFGNIMFDRRVVRGSTFASTPMPVSENPIASIQKPEIFSFNLEHDFRWTVNSRRLRSRRKLDVVNLPEGEPRLRRLELCNCESVHRLRFPEGSTSPSRRKLTSKRFASFVSFIVESQFS